MVGCENTINSTTLLNFKYDYHVEKSSAEKLFQSAEKRFQKISYLFSSNSFLSIDFSNKLRLLIDHRFGFTLLIIVSSI